MFVQLELVDQESFFALRRIYVHDNLTRVTFDLRQLAINYLKPFLHDTDPFEDASVNPIRLFCAPSRNYLLKIPLFPRLARGTMNLGSGSV